METAQSVQSDTANDFQSSKANDKDTAAKEDHPGVSSKVKLPETSHVDEKPGPSSTQKMEKEPAAESVNEASTSAKNDKEKDKDAKEGLFECNICLESPNDPVVSYCGHLFCWSCLHGWLEMKPEGTQSCPVCKAACDRDKVIPLYGRNSKGEDPRNKAVPPRPQAHRTEQTATGNYQNPLADFPIFGFGNTVGGFHLTMGFGASPFAMMANVFAGNVPAGQPDQGAISKVFLWFAMLLILWLIFF